MANTPFKILIARKSTIDNYFQNLFITNQPKINIFINVFYILLNIIFK